MLNFTISNIFDVLNIKTSANEELEYIVDTISVSVKRDDLTSIPAQTGIDVEKALMSSVIKDIHFNIYKVLITAIKTNTIVEIPEFESIKDKVFNLDRVDSTNILNYLESDVIITSARLADLFVENPNFKMITNSDASLTGRLPYFAGTCKNKMIFVDPNLNYDSGTIFGLNCKDVSITVFNNLKYEIIAEGTMAPKLTYNYKYRFDIGDCKFVNYK